MRSTILFFRSIAPRGSLFLELDEEKKTVADVEGLFKKGLLNSSVDVTADEVAYFRNHPDEVDDFTAPVNIRKRFLGAGALLGAGIVAISKALKYGALENYLSVAASEFWVDIIFEVGVALIGAAVTAYLLEILLNTQQENAAKWRDEIRRQIGEEA
jgi:hypothetical protein